jgi:uncharacterized repeat protein (TIGR03803 family)
MRPKLSAPASITLLAVIAITLLFALAASAGSTYKVLYRFKGGKDGAYPSGALVFDALGNLYGTTSAGGGTSDCSGVEGNGCGTVFELTPGTNGKWSESVLYRFQSDIDGANPNGSLLFDATGNLYGTTNAGGSSFCLGIGCGVVFNLTPAGKGKWTESVLYNFQNGAQGASPLGGLLFDAAGNLYGSTSSGGEDLGGVAFALMPGSSGWTFNNLHSFCLVGNCVAEGSEPFAGLAADSNGNLYGTTLMGGNNARSCGGFPGGCGVVFRLTPSHGGWTESVLHKFVGPEGVQPAARVTLDNQGNIYGATGIDGAFGFGTVFKLAPASGGRWKFTVIYNFRSGTNQGSFNSGLVVDAAGSLYGATTFGGKGSCAGAGCGAVYKLTPGRHGRWTYTALHNFSGGQDGGQPSGDLILDTNGHIFGTAGVGGVSGSGVVFEITP